MTPEVKRLLAERDSRIAELEKKAAGLRAEMEDSRRKWQAELEAQRQEWLAERERLMKELDTLLKHCQAYDQRIDRLKFRIQNLNMKLYGRTSEVLEDPVVTEPDLFAGQPPATKEEKKEEAREPQPKRRRSPRKPLPKDLPRETVVIDVKEEEKACEGCGSELQKIGEDVREELEHIPAQFFVRRIVRPRRACSKCKNGVVQAPLPPPLLPQSGAGVSLIASIINAKFLDHVPLCRMERILDRHGVDLDRARMSSWLMTVSEKLEPLVGLMKERLSKCFVLGADETPVKMQLAKRAGPRGKAVKTCHMWVYHGDETAPFTVYDFQETRGRDGPKKMLTGFKGYLQTDAYSVYESLSKSGQFGFKRAGCMAHARRKFVEAYKNGDVRAGEAIALIRELYAVEKQLPEVREEERTAYREKHAAPVMEKLRAWLGDRFDVLPKSALGEAIDYTLKNWDVLRVYLQDARISIDNNAVERAIRPVALGRRNWLFAGSPRGGRAAGIFFTLLDSCQRNGHNPWLYMNDILTRLPTTPAEELHTLLPDAWEPAKKH